MKIIRTVNIVLDDASETSVTARSNVFLYSAIRASRFSPPRESLDNYMIDILMIVVITM